MSERIESSSSINTHRQCPRKYWYRYVKRLKGGATIATTRGNIVHDVLEEFFRLDWNHTDFDRCVEDFKQKTQQMLRDTWQSEKYQKEMKTYTTTEAQLLFTFEESMIMLLRWMDRFAKDVKKLKGTIPFPKAFNIFAPTTTEREYTSQKWRLTGKIDTVHKFQGKIIVRDYKTSKRDTIDDKLMLQASIYALLYLTTHKKAPNEVCFDFLKHKPKYIPVNKKMLNDAIKEIKIFHKETKSKDKEKYPKKTSPLCKWRTGQCDFYDICDPQGKNTKEKV